jgi:D-alanyl-D-alanine carboxypeptidase
MRDRKLLLGSILSISVLASADAAPPLEKAAPSVQSSADQGTFTNSHSQGEASRPVIRQSEPPPAGNQPTNRDHQVRRSERPNSQSVAANTPAAEQFLAWLAAFNSGDRSKLQAFLERNFPARARNLEQELRFRNMTGGLEFQETDESGATNFSGMLKERNSDQFVHLEMEVEPGEPHRIMRMLLRPIPRPADFAVPRMSEADAFAALGVEMDKQAAADQFSGAVLAAKNGKPVFSRAYGLADRERKIPNTLDTRFRIGSMNKMFTAVAVLQMVQSGKISLTDTVGKYLTDYPNKDLASKVTIHHLLTHTGGTGDFFGPEYNAHRLELRTLQDYVKLFGQRGPQFEPGSRWAYSNYGFLLLGVIIERVSGQTYYDYVRDHVYAPAGMKSTNSLPEDQAVPQRSIGYTKMGGGEGWRPNSDTLPYHGTSAGGGYSTVRDLVRFAQALESHKLLDAQHTNLLTSGKVDTGHGDKYAYGFSDRTENGVRSFGHGGGAPGMNGQLTIYPQSGYVVAVLANLDPPAAEHAARFMGDRLPEK